MIITGFSILSGIAGFAMIGSAAALFL